MIDVGWFMSTEFLQKLDNLIEIIKAAPILDNSFLILGAGKFGKIALSYVKSQPNSPHILIIDKDFEKFQGEFRDFSKIVNMHEFSSTSKQRKFYIQKDISITSELFKHLFPENFIPAVPIHAVAYIFQKLYSSLQPLFPLNTHISQYEWNEIIRSIPEQVILKQDPDNGIILLSWAKMDEICPSDCIAPLNYCPHHHRNKTSTITEIVQQIKFSTINNLTLESHQVQPGLGMIYGKELKSILIESLSQIQTCIALNRKITLLISTTCNCHGVINGFMCSSL
jgi:hypothetical protein